ALYGRSCVACCPLLRAGRACQSRLRRITLGAKSRANCPEQDRAMIPNAHRMFNFDLGETADALRETVQSFAANEIAPRAAEIDKSNQFPLDLWPKMGALGLHGITVEEGYGGSGAGYFGPCARWG